MDPRVERSGGEGSKVTCIEKKTEELIESSTSGDTVYEEGTEGSKMFSDLSDMLDEEKDLMIIRSERSAFSQTSF